MSEREWWEPVLCDEECLKSYRVEFPETADWSAEEIRDQYNNGRKYVCTWDHVGDAYEQFEPLADAYLKLRAERDALKAEVDRLRVEMIELVLPLLGDDGRAVLRVPSKMTTDSFDHLIVILNAYKPVLARASGATARDESAREALEGKP